MTNVLGYPLETAAALLASEGYAVLRGEVRCRKGVQGTDVRVLRQQMVEERTVLLTYAGFLTHPQQ